MLIKIPQVNGCLTECLTIDMNYHNKTKHIMKNNVNKKSRRQNPYSLIARRELPLTTISSKSNHENKDFHDVIVEYFEDISNQIKSFQKALAHHRLDFNHHRHDFNLRISNVENLLSWRISKMEPHKGTSLHKKPSQN
jgi:hypothetical protein